jgi:HEAT repeat protein
MPFERAEVLLHLQDSRFDPSPDVRHAARAALARLGERQALQWFRQALGSENRHRVLEAVQAVKEEGLTLLWPELDKVSDLDDPELASFTREVLEQMQEDFEYRIGQ